MSSSTIARKAPSFAIILRLSLAIAVLCLMANPAWAQLYSGTLTGVVTDPSGAVVPGANVTVTDTGKGTVFTATTDATGRYLVRALPPSTYRLGDRSHRLQELRGGRHRRCSQSECQLDVGLTLGTGSQSVEVSAAATAARHAGLFHGTGAGPHASSTNFRCWAETSSIWPAWLPESRRPRADSRSPITRPTSSPTAAAARRRTWFWTA